MTVGKIILLTIVVFWNVENYFDPFEDELTLDDEFVFGGTKRWSWDKFLRKKSDIAKTVMLIGDAYGSMPDVVGLAEIENRFVLNKLVYETALARVGYRVIHRDSKDRRGIDVALLYKEEGFKPLKKEFLEVKLSNNRTTREILYVKGVFLVSQDTVHLFVCHFPSKYGGAKVSAPSREAAALRLIEKCDSLKDQRIICMGDFNDDYQSPALRPLLQLEPLIEKIPNEGTIRFRGQWETIDNFYVGDSIAGSAKVFAAPFLLEEESTYLGNKPNRTYIGPRYNGGISDHLPIVLKLY